MHNDEDLTSKAIKAGFNDHHNESRLGPSPLTWHPNAEKAAREAIVRAVRVVIDHYESSAFVSIAPQEADAIYSVAAGTVTPEQESVLVAFAQKVADHDTRF